MKLYGTYLSPFTARVLLVARAKGQSLALTPPPADGPDRDAYLAINPTGKFPFLDDDGFHLSESAVIADYLDMVLPGPALWPAEPRAKARSAFLVRMVDIRASSGLTAIMSAIMAGNVPAQADRLLVAEGIRLIDANRDDSAHWLSGDSFTHADAALIPLLFIAQRFDRASGAWAAVSACPAIVRYWERAQESPIVADLLAPMIERAIILEKGEGAMSFVPARFDAAERQRKADAMVTADSART